MPVYICQAGSNSAEPWRHGLQVYAAPFELPDVPAGTAHDSTASPRMVPTSYEDAIQMENRNYNNVRQQERQREQVVDATDAIPARHAESSRSQMESNVTNDENNSNRDPFFLHAGLTVRRIRHAEVVLVDDVCIAFGRHWLRLRWPGRKGGFAGYVALGKVNGPPLSRQISDVLLQGTFLCTGGSLSFDSNPLIIQLTNHDSLVA